MIDHLIAGFTWALVCPLTRPCTCPSLPPSFNNSERPGLFIIRLLFRSLTKSARCRVQVSMTLLVRFVPNHIFNFTLLLTSINMVHCDFLPDADLASLLIRRLRIHAPGPYFWILVDIRSSVVNMTGVAMYQKYMSEWSLTIGMGSKFIPK